MPAVVYDALLGSGVTISQVESGGLSNNVTVTPGYQSAGVLADALFVDKAEPVITLGTTDLFTTLTEISLSNGLCITDDTIALPFAVQNCAGALSGGSHVVATAGYGFAVIQSITGSNDGKAAMANIEVCLLSEDGFTDPVGAVTNGSLTSAAFIAAYRLAKVTLGGTEVQGITQVTINPGVGYIKRPSNGGPFNTNTYREHTVPTIDLTFDNQAAFAGFGPMTGDQSALVVYFAKKSDGGDVVSLASSEHIAISCGDNLSVVDTFKGQGRSLAEVTVKIHAKQLAVSLTSAIP